MDDDFNINIDEYERTPYSGNTESHLPAGLYSGVVTRVVSKTNSERAKDPTGKYMEIEFDILAPSMYCNRKIWEKFIYKNISPDAVRIGKEGMSDLARALGFSGNFNDVNAMLGRECCFYLEVVPAKDQYPAKNKVKKFLPAGSTEEHYFNWVTQEKKKAPTPAGSRPTEKPKWGNAAPAAQQAQATPSWKK